MAAPDLSTGPCSMARAAGVLGDRWTLLIMRSAMLGRTRFEQFRTSLGIADNILANRLSRLVDAGLLSRQPYQDGARTRQHYPITKAGAALRPTLEAMSAWGHDHVNPEQPAEPVRIIHTVCGHATTNGSFCSYCEIPIDNQHVAWLMPWLSPDPMPLATA